MLSFFPRDVFDGIWDLIGSVSEGFIRTFAAGCKLFVCVICVCVCVCLCVCVCVSGGGEGMQWGKRAKSCLSSFYLFLSSFSFIPLFLGDGLI